MIPYQLEMVLDLRPIVLQHTQSNRMSIFGEGIAGKVWYFNYKKEIVSI